MPKSIDPLAGTDRLVVDGSNLLHALRRTPAGAPPAAIIGTLRGVIPGRVGIELVFDGPAEPGMFGTRIASGLVVRRAGRRSADDLIVALVDETRRVAGPSAMDGLLVVTDDNALRAALRGRGVRAAGTRWLIGRLERGRLSAPSPGNRRPADGSTLPEVGDDEQDIRRWQPGRGATAKRGNPRRPGRTRR